MLLLHLSDIHFRHDVAGTAMDPNRSLRNEIVRDVESMCQQLGEPNAILISGDIAYSGRFDEYKFAQDWLEQLCSRSHCAMQNIFVSPGNHDVARDVAGRRLIQALHHQIKSAGDLAYEPALRGMLTDAETGRLLYEPINAYNLFAGQFFCDLLPPERTMARRDFKLNDGSTLRMSGFNSALISSAADTPGHLYLDPACYQLERERGVEHLVMCHHPFHWLRGGELLKDHLNDIARIQLFGHDHRNRIELARDWVRVSAVAMHPDRAEPNWEPGYNFIRLVINGSGTSRHLQVDTHIRVWQVAPRSI